MRARRLRRAERGATAIEFAIIGLLFFSLIFGILELALIFFTSSVMSHAVSEAGRTIRVGQFQGCGTEDEFKALVCEKMSGLMSCEKNLRVDVIKGTSFKQIKLPKVDDGGAGAAPTVGSDGKPVKPTVKNGQFDANAAGDPIAVRGTFYYPLVLPPTLTRLETKDENGNVVAKNRHIIMSTTAFRNEPFPDNLSCAVNTGTASN